MKEMFLLLIGDSTMQQNFSISVTLKQNEPFLEKKSEKQYSTEEANESRHVTKVRWALGSANGHIKQWRALSNVFPNS